VELFLCFPVCLYGVHRDFTFIHTCLYLVAFINRLNPFLRFRIVGAPVTIPPVYVRMNLLRTAERICINFYIGSWELNEHFNDTWFKSYKSSE
jgi:hypothetical protein